jgi:hypothetical protein
MRIKVQIGDINEHGVKIVSGPYKVRNTNAWDFLCPYCKQTFVAPTTNFAKSKSCYACRGLLKRKSSEDITWRNHYLIVAGRKVAKEKGFNLTEEEFRQISSKNCFYCNASPTPTRGHRSWSAYINTNGLDRVDSSVGYLYENVVPCCKYCNFAKSDRTVEEFKEWVAQLAKHQNLI